MRSSCEEATCQILHPPPLHSNAHLLARPRRVLMHTRGCSFVYVHLAINIFIGVWLIYKIFVIFTLYFKITQVVGWSKFLHIFKYLKYIIYLLFLLSFLWMKLMFRSVNGYAKFFISPPSFFFFFSEIVASLKDLQNLTYSAEFFMQVLLL